LISKGLDTPAGVAYAVSASVVRAYQGGTTMKNLAAVLVLLALTGTSLAGEKEVAERLRKAGVDVGNHTDGSLWVYLNTDHIDGALPELCELPGLGGVKLAHPKLTDAQLRTVCSLTWLCYLDLDGCPVTDAHLKQVARVRKLRGLSLADTRVTDAGLEELTALRDLEYLDLDGCAVTDAGLRPLERLTKLEYLDLRNCPNITDAGVARLQKALPNCKIVR
jgi:hypothetical protein